jgi:hypothetical protein
VGLRHVQVIVLVPFIASDLLWLESFLNILASHLESLVERHIGEDWNGGPEQSCEGEISQSDHIALKMPKMLSLNLCISSTFSRTRLAFHSFFITGNHRIVQYSIDRV